MNDCTRYGGGRTVRWFIVALAPLLGAGVGAQESAAPRGEIVEEVSGGTPVSVTGYLRDRGYECTWDSAGRVLSCVGDGDTLRMSSVSGFCTIGDSMLQLPQMPVLRDNDLLLPTAALSAVVPAVGVDTSTQRAAATADSVPAESDSMAPPPDRSVSAGDEIRSVVIDAGHGGKDPGAIGPGGTKEKDIVLPIALALRDQLRERSDITVYMTRTTDTFVELRDRTQLAVDKDADLFISIHANSIGGGKRKRDQVKGYKVFFLSQAKNEEDRRVAMLENSVVQFEKRPRGNNFLQNLLLDLTANEYLLESQDLSIMIAESFAESLKSIRKIHTGVGQGPFWVLYGATMPAVLVETGFISNSREEKLLTEKKTQQRLAEAICTAILTFKSNYEQDL